MIQNQSQQLRGVFFSVVNFCRRIRGSTVRLRPLTAGRRSVCLRLPTTVAFATDPIELTISPRYDQGFRVRPYGRIPGEKILNGVAF